MPHHLKTIVRDVPLLATGHDIYRMDVILTAKPNQQHQATVKACSQQMN